ncbi:glucosaminidase domain-containing protein [Gaetbulibacter aquiaggeris]|uniref:Peptidoglycan hydrolase n=1 Tax=Gaetbulibacter aquiaggeris TaxID=1735373 RepID=A0ABW7MQJ1_9FLAO
MKRIVVLIFLGLIVFSCSSRKVTVRNSSHIKPKPEPVVRTVKPEITEVVAEDVESSSFKTLTVKSTEEYLDLFSDIAQQEMRLYGIPASITLAQGILESSSGKGRLAVEANNHFGIKCHDWTGDRIHHDDDSLQECFRKYNDAKYSFRDHSLFLTTRSRYSKLFELDKDDYKAWARELKAAGYATDKKYPDKLIYLIERYKLIRLDQEVLGVSMPMASVNKAESALTHVVMKGDTLYSISKKYNVTVNEIQTLNGLNGTDLKIGQELFVSPKLKN